ncbi:MAG: hypothetical protein GY862_01705 [Gammaproteobacteria bacterium]|nr:hypothetical protein [Gammaproteobacteria bacterium]
MKIIKILAISLLVYPVFSLSQEDTTPPVLESLVINPPIVSDGETIAIAVKATDDLAGIDHIVLFINNPQGQGESSASLLSFDAATQTYTRSFQVPQYASSGPWYISQIQLHDKAGNVNTLNHNAEIQLGFQVNSQTPDSLPPELHNIEITPDSVEANQDVQISVHATDDLSGIDKVVAFVTNPNGDGERSVTPMTFDAATQRYVRTFHVPDLAPSGEWRVSQIQLYDNAWNQVSFNHEQEINATFSVGCPQPPCDTGRPVLHSIEITPDTVNDGESVTVSVHATDDLSGIESVVLFVTMPSGDGERSAPQLYFDEQTQRYTRTFTVPQFGQSGEWHISQIQIKDKASNETILSYPNEISATFSVGKSRLTVTVPDADKQDELKNLERAAILIHPRGQGTGFKQGISIEQMATHIYRTLQARGYSHDEIHFLSHKPDLDINADGFIDRDVVDGPVSIQALAEGASPRDLTLADVQAAFDWAKNQGSLDVQTPLIVAFVDHALTTGLRLDPFNELLSGEALAGMLNDYQQATGNSVIVILEACHTGSLIEKLSAPNRIIVTAADDKLAYYDNLGFISFSKFYFDNLRRGEDFLSAFELTNNELATYGNPFNKQTPQIDDDGDGVANSSNDGNQAGRYCLNSCYGALSGEITLEVITQNTELTLDEHLPLRVRAGITEGEVISVWALVITPQTADERNEQGFSLQESPKISLTRDPLETGVWAGDFSGFNQAGDYTVTFMAQDDEGFITPATPIAITLVADEGGCQNACSHQLQPNQAQYADGDALQISVPETSAGNTRYLAIALPDGSIYLPEDLNRFVPFSGELIPWTGGEYLIDSHVLFWMPRGNYQLYSLQVPTGQDALSLPMDDWDLEASYFMVE